MEAPDGGELGEGALHVDPHVTGAHRQREGLGGRQAGVQRLVDEQPPHLLERHVADELAQVDPAIAQDAAVAIGLGDLGDEVGCAAHLAVTHPCA